MGGITHYMHIPVSNDADVAHMVQKISRRVIRKLRRLGYLEAGIFAIPPEVPCHLRAGTEC
jgi:hypothetical protein